MAIRAESGFFSEDRREQIHRATTLVRKVMKGELGEEEIPWNDPMFRSAVLHFLRTEAPKLEEAAHKLAIVKEVFGGSP